MWAGLTPTSMATNTTQIATLGAAPIPADRECVRTGTEIAALWTDFGLVNGIASGNIGGGLTNVTNNVAAQALSVAQEAKAIATELQGERRERRSAASRIPLPTGDAVIPISWSPVMPNTLYHVSIVLWGDNTPIGSNRQPGWRVVEGTETTGSVQVNFGNIRSGMSFTYLVEELGDAVLS